MITYLLGVATGLVLFYVGSLIIWQIILFSERQKEKRYYKSKP
jgi:hypothetical protein